MPHTIVSDNSKQFDYDEFKEFCDNFQIKKMLSLVGWPQANGQVEVVNKMIKYNLKTKLKDLKGWLVDELPEVLWAYRTTARTSTREIPFSLAYSYEVVVPVEIGARSLRKENYDLDQNLGPQRRELDFLEEK